MPIKVKKEKLKQKQKQKQSQRQVVNIKIGETKKAIRRRASKKPDSRPIVQQSVQPVQYLYQATGSAPFSNMGVAQPPRPNLLGGAVLQPEEVRQVREQALSQEAQRQIEEVQQAVVSAGEQLARSREALRIGRGAEARPSVLGGGFFPSEDVARQRVLRLDTPLRLREPEEASLYADFPNPEVINIEGENPFRRGIEEEVDIEPLQPEEEEEPMLAGGGAVSGSAIKRRYNYKDGYGTIPQLREQIIDMNMGYTEEDLKRRYPTRVRLIVLLDDLRRGKKL